MLNNRISIVVSIVVAMAVTLMVAVLTYIWVMFAPLPIVYSDGYKTGVLTKITEKGLIFKTYEGQIVLGGLKKTSNGGYGANTFNFTVQDLAVAETLLGLRDQQVTLKYVEFIHLPLREGDTNYIVQAIKK